MAVNFDPTNTVWGENLQDIAIEEPYIYMNDGITLYFDKDNEAFLLMPIYYQTPVEIF